MENKEPTLNEIIAYAQLVGADINKVFDLWNTDKVKLIEYFHNRHQDIRPASREYGKNTRKSTFPEELMEQAGPQAILDVVEYFMDEFEVRINDKDENTKEILVTHPATNRGLASDYRVEEGDDQQGFIAGLVRELKYALMEEIIDSNENNTNNNKDDEK